MKNPTTQSNLFEEVGIAPERIRRARELRGFTQSDLASTADIDQSHIALLERGLRRPSPEVLNGIAAALDLPVTYFLQPVRAYLPEGTLRFRAKSSLGRRVISAIHSEALHFLELVLYLTRKVNTVPVRIRPLREDPTTAARRMRALMGVEAGKPVHHLVRLFEKLGGIVLALSPKSGFDGFAEWGGEAREFPIIALAESDSPDRVRMNLAHELAHLVIHRDLLIPDHQAEDEAFAFAAELLTPAYAVKRDLTSALLNMDSMLALKLKWGVSVQALIRRARDLKVISDRQYRSLNTKINAIGWKFREPGSEQLPLERPRAVRKMAEVAFGAPLQYSDIASELHVPEEQLQEFFDRYSASDSAAKVTSKAKIRLALSGSHSIN